MHVYNYRLAWHVFHSQQVMSQFMEAEELEAILATQDLVAVGEEIDIAEYLKDEVTAIGY